MTRCIFGKNKRFLFDHSVMICVGAPTEVEALKKALAEAKEQASRKKLRLNEVQQELQDAVKKYEALEGNVSARETELTKAHQSAKAARVEARVPSRRYMRP